MKNVVVLFDGTGNEYRDNYTNVARMLPLLGTERNDAPQRVYYHPGLGTLSPFLGHYGLQTGRWLALAFGWGISEAVQSAYAYLMEHYEPNDDLFLFGFSRGAYTAELLSDILWRFNLLERGNEHLIPWVWKYYCQDSKKEDSPKVRQRFQDSFCRPCNPRFLGLFDSVESMGWLISRRIHRAPVTPAVEYGCHALALNEHRVKFAPSRWDLSQYDNENLKQVWFPGCHSDVGGWYQDTGLADITLLWMLEQAQSQGLCLLPNWQDELKPRHTAPSHESRKGLWKLWPGCQRQLPVQAKVHKSVADRMDSYSDYRPILPGNIQIVSNPGYDQRNNQNR